MSEPDTEVRSMRPEDLRAVLAIECAAFTSPWSIDTFRGLLRREATQSFVCDRGGPEGIIGYAVVWFTGPEAELGDLAVRADARRQGVGRRLVEAVLDSARSRGTEAVFLEVRESNVAAQRLYETLDFETSGRRVAYYSNPVEDALVMRRPVVVGRR